jgi:hypothetical protein
MDFDTDFTPSPTTAASNDMLAALQAAGVDLTSLLSDAVQSIRPDGPSVDPSALFSPSSPSANSDCGESINSESTKSGKKAGGGAIRSAKGKRKAMTPEEKAAKAHERLARASVASSWIRQLTCLSSLMSRSLSLRRFAPYAES